MSINPEDFITELRKDNHDYYSQERGRGMLEKFEQAFAHNWIYIAELVQNAIDVGARALRFEADGDGLIFEHDGKPFAEDNVRRLSTAGISSKTTMTVGFMGIGFKSVFHAWRQVRISSGPWHFGFDVDTNESWLGSVLPCWDASIAAPTTSFTTRFQFQQRIISDTAKEDIDQVFGAAAALLPLLARRGIERITLQGMDLNLVVSPSAHTGDIETVRIHADSTSDSTRCSWLMVSKSYRPNDAAIDAFFRHRRTPQENRNTLYEEIVRGRFVELFVPVAPQLRLPSPGRAHAVLPTEFMLPLRAHVQADWLLNLDRSVPRDIDGDSPWHSEIRAQLPELIAALLSGIQALSTTVLHRGQALDLLPNYDSEVNGKTWLLAKDRNFDRALANALRNVPCLPAVGTGKLVKPVDARLLPEAFLPLASQEWCPELLFGPHVVSPGNLSPQVQRTLKRLKLISELDLVEFQRNLGNRGVKHWLDTSPDGKVPDGKVRNSRLIALLAALKKHTDAHRDQLRSAQEIVCLPSESGDYGSIQTMRRLPGDWGSIGSGLRPIKQVILRNLQRNNRILSWSLWREIIQGSGKSNIDPEHGFARKFLSEMSSIADDLESLISLWWEHAAKQNLGSVMQHVIVLTNAARKANRHRLVTHVLARRNDGPLELILAEDALLGAPYSSADHRNRIFKKLPSVADTYINADSDSNSPEEWMRFFAKMTPALKGAFYCKPKDAKHPCWCREELAQRLKTKLDEIAMNGNYRVIDQHLPDEWPTSATLGPIQAPLYAAWLADCNLSELGEWLRLSVEYRPRSSRSSRKDHGETLSTLGQRLAEQAWVPTMDGRVLRPSQALRTRDPARPAAPVAKLAPRLIATLETGGIVFGTEVPEAGVLEWLSSCGEQSELSDLCEKLREACTHAETDAKVARQLKDLLQSQPLLPADDDGKVRRTADRFVRKLGHGSNYGGWLVAVNRLSGQVRAALDAIDQVLHFAEEPAPVHALDFIRHVWRQECASEAEFEALPHAYRDVVAALEDDAALRGHWHEVRSDARVCVGRQHKWTVVADACFNDLAARLDQFERKIGKHFRVAISSQFGHSAAQQKTVAQSLGLECLSARIEILPEFKNKQRRPDLAARLRQIGAFAHDSRHRSEDGSEEDGTGNGEFGIGLVSTVEALKIRLIDLGADAVLSEDRPGAIDDNGELLLTNDLAHAGIDLPGLLLARWSLNQHGEICSDIGQLIGALDDGARFDHRLEALRKRRGLTGPGPANGELSPLVLPSADDPKQGELHAGRPDVEDCADTDDASPAVPDAGTEGNIHRRSAGGTDHSRSPRMPEALPAAHDREPGRSREPAIMPQPYTVERADTRARRLQEELIRLCGTILEPAGEEDIRPSSHREFGDDAAPRAFAMRYEREQGRHPEAMAFDQEGYDLESWSAPVGTPGRTLLRRVEIKGRGRPWQGAEIVTLSAAQFRQAQADGDRYWLYVIARGADGRPVLHALRDPAGRCRRHELRAVRWVPFIDECWTAPADGGHLDFPDDLDDLDDPDAAAGTGTP